MTEVFPDTHSQQAQGKTGEPSGFARRSCLESLAGVYASDGAIIINERSVGVYADRGAALHRKPLADVFARGGVIMLA